MEVGLSPVFGLALAPGETAVNSRTSSGRRHRPGDVALVPTGAVGNLPVTLRLSSSNASIGRLPTAFVTVPLLDAAVRLGVGDEGTQLAELRPVTYSPSTSTPRTCAISTARPWSCCSTRVLQVLGGGALPAWTRAEPSCKLIRSRVSGSPWIGGAPW